MLFCDLSGEYWLWHNRVLRPDLFAEHLRPDENQHGSAQAASEKEINQGITGGGKHGRYQECQHRYEWMKNDSPAPISR